MSQSIDEQKRFYDDRWRGAQFASSLKLARTVAILQALAETGLDRPRCIELGSGTGWLSAILGQFGPTTGVELSPEAVEVASKRYSFVDFMQADVSAWSPSLQPFDVVVSHEVLEHLTDQPGHLALAHRLLRPGGYLILTTPNADTIRASGRDNGHHDAANPLSDQPIENVLPWRTVGALVTEAGFEIVSERTLILGHGSQGMRRLVNSPKVRGALRRIGMLGAVDRRALSAGYGLHTLVVARRI